ncbi:anthranilate N-benzoyltransferase protein 2-like [Chenopodium quinoa]|uniref:anthranilate N-benzoyltransferase protein 2-like n=1 Tax=Chenopodium quinoa TaxID=63459 RepID=UPI000B7729A7|nr:anthranilate N-benzoyltransferase protein 2-like [Chenopodium quinoa]
METEECVFQITKQQMSTLKLQATSPEGTRLSTFEVQAGHVWRSVCKARGLADDDDVKPYIPIDGRSRLKDRTLPQNYCGNILLHAVCVEKVRDVTTKPLWFAATKVREAVKKLDDIEYLRSSIDYVESHPDIAAITLGPHTFTSPNLTINSWARLPCFEADFGLDGPKFVEINGIKYEGITYITSSPNGDGSFLVAIKLFTPDMILFKNYFYNF